MSFGIEISFEGSCLTIEYRWATAPSDNQVDDVVNEELKLFRYKNIASFMIKGLRDSNQTSVTSGNLTISKI